MSKINSTSLILNAIKKHYNFKTNTEFAVFLGIKPQTLSSWYTRGTIDYDLLYSKCVDIDGNWLLSGGEGEMLKKNVHVVDVDNKNSDLNNSQIDNFNKTISAQEKTIASQEETISLLKMQIEQLKDKD